MSERDELLARLETSKRYLEAQVTNLSLDVPYDAVTKEHVATIEAAIKALSAPSATEEMQKSIKALDEVNAAWFNELEEIKKIVGYVPAECKQTLTRYIKGIVSKAQSSPVEEGPMIQYYYKTTGCKAEHPKDPDCICWHDKGTGPLTSGWYKLTSLRIKPNALRMKREQP